VRSPGTTGTGRLTRTEDVWQPDSAPSRRRVRALPRGPRRGPRRARRLPPALRDRVAPGRRPAWSPRSAAGRRGRRDRPPDGVDGAIGRPARPPRSPAARRVPLRIPHLRRPASHCCGFRNCAAPAGLEALRHSAIALHLAPPPLRNPQRRGTWRSRPLRNPQLRGAWHSRSLRIPQLRPRPGRDRCGLRNPCPRARWRAGACGRPWRRGARILAMPQAVRRSPRAPRARPTPRTHGDGDRQCVTQPRP
jgi:hypothetical protein